MSKEWTSIGWYIKRCCRERNTFFMKFMLFVFCWMPVLCLLNGTCRACACAGTAIDALSRVDLELAVAHADSAYRALCLTSATRYTAVINYECHIDILLML